MSKRVYPAEPYQWGALGSLGDARYMLLRQYEFPDSYSANDILTHADSDRCFSWDYDHCRRCFDEHTGNGELAFGDWVKKASIEQVFAFLKDILKADTSKQWTGFRVMGTVHRGNGFPVWTLELFSKHPESNTHVYTGENAPNVVRKISVLGHKSPSARKA